MWTPPSSVSGITYYINVHFLRRYKVFSKENCLEHMLTGMDQDVLEHRSQIF